MSFHGNKHGTPRGVKLKTSLQTPLVLLCTHLLISHVPYDHYSFTLTTCRYLRQVLDEGLRIGMIANFSAHCSNEDEIVGGHTIPAHTPILQAIGVTMMDDSIWEKPEW